MVDMSKIDRVPVSLIMGIKDDLCRTEQHEFYFHQIKSPNSHIQYMRGGHLVFFFRADDAFLRRMIQTIETG